jgi:hypothetical protein
MEEPPPPAALDPPILPLEDVVPLPPTVPTSFVPSADPVPTPLAMTHFALMETAQLLDTASAPPLPRPCGCSSLVSYTGKASIVVC